MAHDSELFDEVRQYSLRLIAQYKKRDQMFEDMRKMFFMEWRQAPGADWIKKTMSPTAYNTVLGTIRLLTATEPQLSIPYDEVDSEQKAVADKLEQAAKAMLAGSGRVALRPVHYEVAFSNVLYGESMLTVTKTDDLLRHAKQAKNKRMINRMKWVEQQTPYLFQVWNPETAYPDFDKFGLRGMLRRTRITWAEAHDAWGALAEAAYPGDHLADELVVLNDWYDWENRVVWLDRAGMTLAGGNTAGMTRGVMGTTSDVPILAEAHDLDFMPVVAQLSEGSFLFDEPDKQRLPLLYALLKSGLWQRENLSLTVVFSLVYALGSAPLMLRKTSQPGSPMTIDRSVPGGVVDISPDEDMRPLAEKVLDPAHMQILDLAERLATESTIPKMALGAPPSRAMAFSAISLLAQAGRLPLVSPKEASGNAIANALMIALQWMRADKDKARLYRNGKWIELSPQDIPERVVIKCDLEPELPTDKLQQANIANMLVGTGLASKRWARENILTIGQSDAMTKEIYMEHRLQAEIDAIMAKLQKEAEAPPPPPEGGPGGAPAPVPPPLPDLMTRPITEGEMEGLPPVGEAGPMTSDAMQGIYPPGHRIGAGSPLTGPLPGMMEQVLPEGM